MLPRALAGALLLALAALPLAGPRFLVTTLAEVFIFGMLALSLDLLLGYTGLVSMGHAALFGFGAYVAGLLSVHFTSLIWVTAPVAVITTALLAMAMGYLALRASGVTFLMVTLAFGQMLYALAVKWNGVTGGSDGLTGVARPTGLLMEMNTTGMYWLLLLSLVGVLLFLRRVIASPFGAALVSIRENEERMRALGLNVFRYKLGAFVVAGAVAGLAGALFAHLNGFVSPGELHWMASGQLLVMVVIGGAGTLTGPIWGAAMLMLLHHFASSYTDRWQSIVGLIFIAFVLGARGGLMGLLRREPRRKGVAA